MMCSTKIIPEELVPIEWIGKIVLDRIPSDFFSEVEQVAFVRSPIYIHTLLLLYCSLALCTHFVYHS